MQFLLVFLIAAQADDAALDEVVVHGREENILGVATSASQGAIGSEDLRTFPLLRRGELLETVPGMVVTQHSGDGKANQYFLRGFNLDHGTDFAFSVDGVPVNLRTHAHGQGYSDLNFMIPELVSAIEYRKGPFYADVGDFSGSGAAEIKYVDTLPSGIATLQGGMYGYARALIADAPELGPGRLLYALEYNHYEGPWDLKQHSNRYNGVLRYSVGEFKISANVYIAPQWRSTDQIPARAVDAIGRYGNVDPTDGGRTSRYALSADWTHDDANVTTKLTAYAVYYRLDLYSNFTYFLDDPVNGDQFAQIDRRLMTGADVRQSRRSTWFGRDVENIYGVQVRNDWIPRVELFHSAQRQRLETYSNDRVEEFSAGAHVTNKIQWTEWFRSEVGVRADVYAIDVDAGVEANSGEDVSAIVNPKAALVFGPWANTEFYVNGGSGFHSNDARGVTTTTNAGVAQEAAPLLVRTWGTEVGARTSIVPGLVTTVGLWYLISNSELTFAGDSGDTEANGKSRKYGVEWANFYAPTDWLTLTADASFTHARYTDGAYIQNAIPFVLTGSATVNTPIGIFGALRLRHFSDRPLSDDGDVRTDGSTIVNAKVGFRHAWWEASVDVLNIFNSKSNDIAYFYTSRLQSETAAVDDTHQHPVEPVAARVSLTARF